MPCSWDLHGHITVNFKGDFSYLGSASFCFWDFKPVPDSNALLMGPACLYQLHQAYWYVI